MLAFKKKSFAFILLIFVLMFNCQNKKNYTDADIANKWAEMTLFITKNTPGNSPTYASRCFGYIGLTMYESVVNGFPEYQSLQGQLAELKNLPKPIENQNYNWQLSLNAAQAEIIRKIYNQSSDLNKSKIDSLESTLNLNLISNLKDLKTAERSVLFGKAIADSIFEWSKTDGGHRGYLKNFDKKMKYPVKLGSWKPPLYGQSFSHYPLQPHWGENRTFLPQNKKIIAPKPIPYDTLPTSAYYQQFLAVYNKKKMLNEDQKQAAIWWGDDPDETFTPPGHSYYLATLIIDKNKPTLIKCAETYAKVGMAVADAFTNCWKWKYVFFTERPNTFINEHIDEKWESFWPDPPFPAFPSGHAIQAGASSVVLIDLYGDNIKIIDNAHLGRKKDGYRNLEFKPRTFNSISEIAKETADSRFYGGIHIKNDNEAGLEKGQEIGQNINRLKWKK